MADRVVDYSPLTTKPAAAEVTAFRAALKASGTPWASTGPGAIVGVVVLVFVALVFVLPLLGGMAVFVVDGVRGGSPIGVFFIVFALLVVALLVFAVVKAVRAGSGRWERWYRMDRFARANGLQFSARDANPAYPGAVFQIGDSRAALEHFRTIEGRYLDFGNYQYSTGSGKSRRTHTWGFLALQLDRRLPHMVLDSRANNGVFGGTNLPAYFDKSQVLSLEGDFDRYFTLYCPARYERDALYVFTPDLMALLIDEAAPFDVEIVDDWMFVYSGTPFAGDPATYGRLFRIVETVGARTLAQTDRYRDERAAVPFAANVVAPQGARLTRGVSIGAVLVFAFFALLWGWGFVADVVEGFVR